MKKIVIVVLLGAVASVFAGEAKLRTVFKPNLEQDAGLKVGEKPGFRQKPTTGEAGGVKYFQGPTEIDVEPVEGILSITFDLLGFHEAGQANMIDIRSEKGQFAYLRNINRSLRVMQGYRRVIVCRFKKDVWHRFEMTLDTGRGELIVTVDGKEMYREKTSVSDAAFTGLWFGSMSKVANLKIAAQPFPPATPAEQEARSARAKLAKAIDELPVASESEKRKNAVLSYHLERLDRAIYQKTFDYTGDIIDDIKVGLKRDVGREDLKQTWLRPVAQQENNPYLDRDMNEKWYASFASRPDYDWKVSTKRHAVYRGLHHHFGTRAQADQANGWMLLYSHPQSPLKGRQELLIRAMRRIDIYMRDYAHHETVTSNGSLSDFFALGPALMGAVMIQKTYPEMLLPKQRKIWAAAAEKVIANYYRRNYNGNYANADLASAGIFISAALLIDSQKDLDHGLALANTWDQNLHGDGGGAYIGDQNESPGYHNACVSLQYDLYLMTGDPKMLETIKKTEYYTISLSNSSRATEFYTAPSWKQRWYGPGLMAAHPYVYWLTGNQYYRTLKEDKNAYESADSPNMKNALLYKSYPYVAKELPDNYTVFDQNIQGARVNYGLWAAGMNGRVITSHVGKNTYVGLTLSEPDQTFNAILYGINAFPVGSPNYSTIDEESVSVAVAQHAAALGADYHLARRLAGPNRRKCDWKGRQAWLLLPDRMIGLVEVMPGRKAFSGVTMNLELGRSMRGDSFNPPLEKIKDQNFRYGNLEIIVHDTNFAGSKIVRGPDGITSDDGSRNPHYDLHFTDAANLSEWSKQNRLYDTPYYALVELKRNDAKHKSKATKILQDGNFGLTVNLGEQQYTTIYNSSDFEVEIDTTAFTGNGDSSLFSDHKSFADGQSLVEPIPVPVEVKLPAKRAVLIVSGKDEKLHRPGIIGWKNFIPYYEEHISDYD
jgi:hypothetical protein